VDADLPHDRSFFPAPPPAIASWQSLPLVPCRSVEAIAVGVSWLNHRVVGTVVTVASQIGAFC
jgi:hypothetical protein